MIQGFGVQDKEARRGFGTPRLHDVNMAAWIARHEIRCAGNENEGFPKWGCGLLNIKGPLLGGPCNKNDGMGSVLGSPYFGNRRYHLA